MYKFSKIQPPYSEFIPLTPEQKAFGKTLMKLYDSRGIKSSTLSKDGDDSNFIKS